MFSSVWTPSMIQSHLYLETLFSKRSTLMISIYYLNLDK